MLQKKGKYFLTAVLGAEYLAPLLGKAPVTELHCSLKLLPILSQKQYTEKQRLLLNSNLILCSFSQDFQLDIDVK